MPTKKVQWYWPVRSQRITQVFGGSHRAVDIGVPVGTPVVAPTSGKVIKASPDTTGYGNLVEIQSGNQRVYLAHLSRFAVAVGQQVRAGQVVGYSGNTGRSTGPHLHYEIRQGDSGRVDPLSLSYIGAVLAKASAPVKSIGSTVGKAVAQVVRIAPAGVSTVVTGKAGATPARTSAGAASTVAKSNLLDMIPIDWTNVLVAIIGVVLIGAGAIRTGKQKVQKESKVIVAAAKTAISPQTAAVEAVETEAEEPEPKPKPKPKPRKKRSTETVFKVPKRPTGVTPG